MSEPASDPTRVRLARLVAAVMWDAQDFFADIYEKVILEDDGCPTVDSVELTEDCRIEILADGEEYVLSVEHHD